MRKGRQGMSLHMQGVFCLYTDKKYFVDKVRLKYNLAYI